MNFEHNAQIVSDDEWEFENLAVPVSEVAKSNTSATSGTAKQVSYKRGPYKKNKAKRTSLRSATISDELTSPAGLLESASLLDGDGVADAPPIKQSNDSCRTWCFTLNNFTEADIEWFKGLECRRIRASKEVGESGTPHLQGVITFADNHRFSTLKKMHDKVSWRSSNSKDAAWNYCNKAGEPPVIDINNKKQGFRSDWAELYDMVQKGGTYDQVAKTFPHLYGPCHIGVKALADAIGVNRPIKRPKRTKITPPDVYWRWGLKGTGKTSWVYENFDDDDIALIKGDYKYFNYNYEKVVIFDELRSTDISLDYLLVILEGYMKKVRTLREWKDWYAEVIVITSPYPPEELYAREITNRDKIDQLLRRIKEVVHCVHDPNYSAVSEV